MRILAFASFIFCAFLAGCATKPSAISYYHPALGEKEVSSLLDKVSQVEAQDFENIKIETLATDEFSSHHLVVIRKMEPYHYHATHDVWALVLKGTGELILGKQAFKIRPGASFFIPAGVRHQATHQGKEPLAAFAIFTPAFDGKDTIPVEDPNL